MARIGRLLAVSGLWKWLIPLASGVASIVGFCEWFLLGFCEWFLSLASHGCFSH